MFLIMGLGNPGKKYEGTRHNIGFRVIEALSRQLELGAPKRGSSYLYLSASYKGNKFILAQPLTYMNRSGYAALDLLKKHKISVEDMLVIYDDLDFSPGVIRFKQNGGSAGHRGVQSIIDITGTRSFDRLRIGIGRPVDEISGADYVLETAEQQENILYQEAIENAVQAVLFYISEGIVSAMNHFNRGVE